jgi:hypothetical protein
MTEKSIYGSSRSVIVESPYSTRFTQSKDSHNSDSSQGDVTDTTSSEVATVPLRACESSEHGVVGVVAHFTTALPEGPQILTVKALFEDRPKPESPPFSYPSLPAVPMGQLPLRSQQVNPITQMEKLARMVETTKDVNKINDLLNGLDAIGDNLTRRLWVCQSDYSSSFADVPSGKNGISQGFRRLPACLKEMKHCRLDCYTPESASLNRGSRRTGRYASRSAARG